MAKKVDWIIHGVCDGQRVNFHTHGMERYNHMDFQMVLPYPHQELCRIINTMGLRVQEGERFKDGDLTAVRFLRRQAKAERLVAAVNVFLDLLINPSHTGKFYFARFVLTDEHTDGNDLLLVLLRLIFALVKQTQLTASLDNLCADPAFPQIFEISGRAFFRPREIQL